ncbi:hypothetical protein ACFY1U_14490 [Streptomyces sp. NPDC001351]|uniref:hypothetical protein n=1 Tax=Streptomyces sp. NPDC001351 TaxID=3364564 RepID=UPI003698EC09
MTTNNIYGPATGNFGDGNTFNQYQAAPVGDATPVAIAAELIRQLRAVQPALAPQAEQVHRELVHAGEHNRPIDQGRIRGWLETIQAGSAAGSGVLALVLSLGRAVGLPM